MQNLIANTFEVVHYIALQAVHYKPLQEVHLSRYNQQGQVGILRVTDKQFGEMILFSCSKKQELPQPVQQLVLF